MKARILSIGLVGAALALQAQPASAAGFFDDLARAFFGAPQPRYATIQQAPAYERIYEPLDVTVQKRRGPVVERSSKPPPPVVKLDPSTDPNWYLKDPTLRRGDIVVTASGVKVYEGRDSDDLRRADFAALTAGKAKSKGKGAWQDQLLVAAQGGRSFFRDATPTSPAGSAPSVRTSESARPAITPVSLPGGATASNAPRLQ